MGQSSWPEFVSGRPVWIILGVESQCHWEEHGEREDLSGKAVSICFIVAGQSSLHCSSTMTRYNDDISLEDAIHTALLTLKEGFEGQMTEKTIEIGVVTVPTSAEIEAAEGSELVNARPKPAFRRLTEEEVRDYLAL